MLLDDCEHARFNKVNGSEYVCDDHTCGCISIILKYVIVVNRLFVTFVGKSNFYFFKIKIYTNYFLEL